MRFYLHVTMVAVAYYKQEILIQWKNSNDKICFNVHLISFLNVADFLACCRVQSGKRLAAQGVNKLIIDENLKT